MFKSILAGAVLATMAFAQAAPASAQAARFGGGIAAAPMAETVQFVPGGPRPGFRPGVRPGVRPGFRPGVRPGFRGPRYGYGGPRYGYRGGYYRRDRGYGYGGAAAAAGIGLAAGALLGSAIASQPGAVYEGDPEAYCIQRFKSYDPASGTYLGYDGVRHPCP